MVEYVLEKQVALRKSQFNMCATSVSTFLQKKAFSQQRIRQNSVDNNNYVLSQHMFVCIT